MSKKAFTFNETDRTKLLGACYSRAYLLGVEVDFTDHAKSSLIIWLRRNKLEK